MLTRLDEKDEAKEVLKHMLTSSMMRQDVARNQLLLFGLVGKPHDRVTPSIAIDC